jgi:hypothetical protein
MNFTYQLYHVGWCPDASSLDIILQMEELDFFCQTCHTRRSQSICPKCGNECKRIAMNAPFEDSETTRLRSLLNGRFSVVALADVRTIVNRQSKSDTVIKAALLGEIALLMDLLRHQEDVHWLPQHLDGMWLIGGNTLLTQPSPDISHAWQVCLQTIEQRLRTSIAIYRPIIASNAGEEEVLSNSRASLWENFLDELGAIQNVLKRDLQLWNGAVQSTLRQEARIDMIAQCVRGMGQSRPALPSHIEKDHH